VPAKEIGRRNQDIQYKCEYFPWFDTDVQRSKPIRFSASKLMRLCKNLLKKFPRIKAMLKRILKGKTKPAQKLIIVKDWLQFYEAKYLVTQGKSFTRPSKKPKVSVIILAYNNLHISQLCLYSLYANRSYENVEIIVVDNASKDDTPTWLETFQKGQQDLKLILNKENAGFAGGNNQAARIATGDYLVFLNNDTVLPVGWIEGLLKYMKKDELLGLVGPVTNAIGNEARIEIDYHDPAGFEAFAARRVKKMKGKSFDIRMLAFYCVMVRREVYLAMGGLDERFGVGMFEDEDMAVRYNQDNKKVICAEDVFIHHFHGFSFSKLKQDRYNSLFVENKKKYEEKWGRKWEPYTFRK